MDFPTSSGPKSFKKSQKISSFFRYPYETSSCSRGPETACHFLLLCPNFTTHRKIIFGILNPILRLNNIPFLEDTKFVHLLLYSEEKLELEENENILTATISFIRSTSLFLKEEYFTNALISSYPNTAHFIIFCCVLTWIDMFCSITSAVYVVRSMLK